MSKKNMPNGVMKLPNRIMSRYLKRRKKGAIPSFNVDKYLKEHTSDIKKYYLHPKRLKKWQKLIK